MEYLGNSRSRRYRDQSHAAFLVCLETRVVLKFVASNMTWPGDFQHATFAQHPADTNGAEECGSATKPAPHAVLAADHLGPKCQVVAPSLVPPKLEDRVSTDRKDALKLAHSYRPGDLAVVWVPDGPSRRAKTDLLRAGHLLSKLLLRHGWRRTSNRPGPSRIRNGLRREVSFEQAAHRSCSFREAEHLMTSQGIPKESRRLPIRLALRILLARENGHCTELILTTCCRCR
jgi:hypothetical protein